MSVQIIAAHIYSDKISLTLWNKTKRKVFIRKVKRGGKSELSFCRYMNRLPFDVDLSYDHTSIYPTWKDHDPMLSNTELSKKLETETVNSQ